jgi:GNAT superfamily N-acetyltransferase
MLMPFPGVRAVGNANSANCTLIYDFELNIYMKTLREMMDLIEAAQQGVSEDAYENAYRQRWARFKPDGEEQSGGMILRYQNLRPGMILVQARSGDGNKELGSVEFRQYDPSSKKWTGEALHVDPRYRRQGVATAMYDWFKRRFGPIRPSDAQTQDGEGFWRGKKVWEQGVSEGLEQKYLWHGSRQKINMLEPRQSVDTGGAAGSNQNAIYATSDPKVAIAMGLTTPGSNTGMFPNDPQMVLFKGNIRRGENVYLHKVPFNGPDGKPQFVQGGNSREFHSISGVKSIKPVEIKAVPVDKYLNLIRQATPADLELQKKYMKQGVAEGQLDETTPEAIAKIDGLTR